MKRILSTAAALILGTAAFMPAQALAQVGVGIVVGNAPPPQRVEVVPVPRCGYQWAPGYYRDHDGVANRYDRMPNNPRRV